MGREIKRVALDFDWPIGTIWPGFMGGVCSEEIRYAVREHDEDKDMCPQCRHFGRLAGLEFTTYNCPVSAVQPPAGDGWQLWETVSEGSPISPVFTTAEGLVDFMSQPAEDGRDGWAQGYDRAVAEAWVKDHGWAPSGIMIGGKMMSGVEGMVETSTEDKPQEDESNGKIHKLGN